MLLELGLFVAGGALLGGGTRTVERNNYYPTAPAKTAAELKAEADERNRRYEADRKLAEAIELDRKLRIHDFMSPWTRNCARCGCSEEAIQATKFTGGIYCVPELRRRGGK